MYHRLLRRTIAPAVTVATAAAVCVCFTSMMDSTRSSSTSNTTTRTPMNTSTTLSRINVFQTNKTTFYEYRMTNHTKDTTTCKNGTNNKKKKKKNTEYSSKNVYQQERLFAPQHWKPNVLPTLPSWDDNWDGKEPKYTYSGDMERDFRRRKLLRTKGVTRQIILIRPGHSRTSQYDERLLLEEGGSQQVLTSLGRVQAHRTGQRLAQYIKKMDGKYRVKMLRMSTSSMDHAKETAQIIEEYLPDSIVRMDPDPNLKKGLPCHYIPVALLIEEGHDWADGRGV